MVFCDVSPFYCDSGGGIRTYHRAKIEWFRTQARHRYVLVHLGPRRASAVLAPNVTLIQLRGIAVSADQHGYRIPVDPAGMWKTVLRSSPDVLELDDPWFSGPLGLLVRRFGRFHGLLASFYHSDPITTYVAPWLRRSVIPHAAGNRLGALSERLFNRLQAGYDVTLVASAWLQQRLARSGIETRRAPFGVDPRLFEVGRTRECRMSGPVRLLYAGRLHADKDIQLVVDVLPQLLAREDVEVTVAGTGPYRDRLARVSHPRFRYVGLVANREDMARLYGAHQVLLAPGRYETFGLAALEAAAAGLLVVGPDEGGTGELLREMRSPLAFHAGDRTSFLDTIAAAIDCQPGEIVLRGRATARAYGTWPEAIGRQVGIYEAMAGGAR